MLNGLLSGWTEKPLCTAEFSQIPRGFTSLSATRIFSAEPLWLQVFYTVYSFTEDLAQTRPSFHLATSGHVHDLQSQHCSETAPEPRRQGELALLKQKGRNYQAFGLCLLLSFPLLSSCQRRRALFRFPSQRLLLLHAWKRHSRVY